jgi:cellobiose phosphorylase
MIHAILEGLLSPAQAKRHLEIIEQHLSGPDGVRLFDRPLPYRGGPMRFFQRAETATFFGREIGLMYMHAHLRYAQALAHLGETDAFFRALCQVVPIAIREIVPSASLRQANCYYSSSDAAFADRYAASDQYGDIRTGRVALDGGWRVYSSGAGIAVSLVVRRFLGINCEQREIAIDPVIPAALDGLRVRMPLYDRPCGITYSIRGRGHGVTRVSLNGRTLALTYEANPYRRGAARILTADLMPALRTEANELAIELG